MISFVRRQPTRYVWLAFLGASLAFVFSRGGQFGGYWLWTADWTAGTAILTGPIATAIAAWHARFQIKHMPDATAAARPSRRAVTAVIYGELALLLSAQAVSVGVAVAYTASRNSNPSSLLHFVPQFFVLAGFIAVGAAVGFAVPSPYTAPVAGVAAFVCELPVVGLPRNLVKFGGATANLVGLKANSAFDLAHSAAGLGVVLLAVVGVSWRITRRRPALSSLTAGALGTLLVAGALSFFIVTRSDRFDVPTTISVNCGHARPGPSMCLSSDIEQLRPTLTRLAAEVAAFERQLGVTKIPTRVVVVPAGADPGPYRPGDTSRPIVLQGSDLNGSVVTQLQAVLPYLVVDRRCLNAHADSDLSVTVGDLQVAADVVLLAITPDPNTARVPEVKTVLSWPTARRNSWVRSVLSAANGCQLASMPPALS